ncbi:9989_t:CDS:1, partial [Racocetra persica]
TTGHGDNKPKSTCTTSKPKAIPTKVPVKESRPTHVASKADDKLDKESKEGKENVEKGNKETVPKSGEKPDTNKDAEVKVDTHSKR